MTKRKTRVHAKLAKVASFLSWKNTGAFIFDEVVTLTVAVVECRSANTFAEITAPFALCWSIKTFRLRSSSTAFAARILSYRLTKTHVGAIVTRLRAEFLRNKTTSAVVSFVKANI
jgi:hypothetical protein